jgi:hypothetical protein
MENTSRKIVFMIGLLDCVVQKAMLLMPFLVIYAMCNYIFLIMDATVFTNEVKLH